jgi:DNA-binding transcriptional LysR family regulator
MAACAQAAGHQRGRRRRRAARAGHASQGRAARQHPGGSRSSDRRGATASSRSTAAVDGTGIAALPRYAAQEALSRGAVRPLLQAWSLPAQEVHAVFPSPRMLPLKVSGFVAWLQAQFEGEWWTRARPAAAPPSVMRP